MRTRQFQFLWSAVGLLLAACGAPLAASNPGPTVASDSATAAIETATPLPQFPPDDCPITQPQSPIFVPPQPYPAQAPYGDFWYGTNDLWTSLRPDGRWHALPHDEQGYGQKVFFWREGYDMTTEQKPQISLSGRRLDGDAPPFERTGGTNGYHGDMGQFMLTGAKIPTAGCWELTARYNDEALSFVVWVAP